MGEEMAEQFCRWDPELKIIGLRFSNVMEPGDYAGIPGLRRRRAPRQVEPLGLHRWPRRRAGGPAGARGRHDGRRDLRHRQCRHVMSGRTPSWWPRSFPASSVSTDLGPNETLLSIEKARRVLGYEPQYSWRDA